MEKSLKFIHNIIDYEHEGDLKSEIQYIKSICPEAHNFNTIKTKDYDSEDEECYFVYIQFEAPEEYRKNLEEQDCYVI